MLEINEVFTPRRAAVNLKTYVPRLDLETELLRSVRGSMHSLLFGESGNGKSWLYKKVLEENRLKYYVANCANALRLGSLTAELVNALAEPGAVTKVGYSENKEASIKAVVAEGKLTHQVQYALQLDEPLQAAFRSVRLKSSSSPIVVVMDNLEAIFSDAKLMRELASIVLLLDDPRFAQYEVKFLVVGVPNDVLTYFAKTESLESVANRIAELPRVGGLDFPMVETLVKNGLNELLRFGIPNEDLRRIAKHVHHITLGVAQRVHEYCEQLAYLIKDSRSGFFVDLLKATDEKWLILGLRQSYTVIESHLNSRKTEVARRNQVIYCIGRLTGHQVDSSRLSDMVSREFPGTAAKNMGIPSILGELAAGGNPLLRKNTNTSEFRVVDPRYVMCIRVMLFKNAESGIVEKRSFRLS